MRDDKSWQVWSGDRAELVRMIGESDSFQAEPAVPPGVVLKRGERLFFHSAGVSLVEMRHAAGQSGASTGFCIPQGRDYDCPEIPAKQITALPPDPYRLDADHDGIACES